MMLGSLMRKILGGESSDGSPKLLKSTVAVAHLKPSSESIKGPKLNLGSGWDIRDGWVNIDMNASHKPDIVADATRELLSNLVSKRSSCGGLIVV
jgi:hypothetical protein